MYSKAHGAVSAAIGVVLVIGGFDFVHPVLVVGYATAIGVLIDLDHFLWARYNTGDWASLRRVLTDPVGKLADQSGIFEETDLGPLQRLLSHVVIVGIAVPLTWWVDPAFGVVTAVTLYAHVLADLVWDVGQASKATP